MIDIPSRRDSGVGEDQSPRTRGAGPEKQQMAMLVSTMVFPSRVSRVHARTYQ